VVSLPVAGEILFYLDWTYVFYVFGKTTTRPLENQTSFSLRSTDGGLQRTRTTLRSLEDQDYTDVYRGPGLH